MMVKLLLVGFGAMGQAVYRHLRDDPNVQFRYVLERSERCAAVQQVLGAQGVAVSRLADIPELPDLALECAGHAAVQAYVPGLLSRGVDTILASVGTLAHEALAEHLEASCRASGARLTLVPGALGGIDALAAARHHGLDSVRYTGRKAPTGWLGTPAESVCELTALTDPFVIFEGSARDAARQFPQNANVAAMVGIAGIGMDRTHVQLIADPRVARNTHTIEASGAFGRLAVQVEANPLPDNPKTSALAAMAIVRQVQHRYLPWVL